MSDPVPTLRAAIRFARRQYAKRATHIDGHVLTVYREAAGVTAQAVADSLGVTKQRISNIESTRCPVGYAARYREAVERIAGQAPPITFPAVDAALARAGYTRTDG